MKNYFNILTIDDDLETFKTVTHIVSKHPRYQLTHLDSTCLLPDILKVQRFESIVCDFSLVAHNRFSTLRDLRKANPYAAILLLVDPEIARFNVEALEAGADGFFDKPFTYDKFIITLNRSYWNALDRLDWWEVNASKLVNA